MTEAQVISLGDYLDEAEVRRVLGFSHPVFDEALRDKSCPPADFRRRGQRVWRRETIEAFRRERDTRQAAARLDLAFKGIDARALDLRRTEE